MRILHVIPRFIGGGPERSLIATVHEMNRAGIEHESSVVVLESPMTSTMVIAARRARIAVALHRDDASLIDAIAAADIVQVHHWNHPALTRLLRTVPFPPTRVMVTSHVLGRLAPQVLTEAVAGFADALTVTSEVSLDSEGARLALAAGTAVTYVPDVADMSRLDGFERRPHVGVCVGYLGVVSDSKMHGRFAEMAAAVNPSLARFEVYGSGGGEELLRARLAALGAGDRVQVLGHVENVRTAFEGMDVFGYPLCEDTYATSEKALQEAMWVGLPPVVFPAGGISRIVEHERTGLVATTEQEYVAAVERLAADPALRTRLGDAARAFARAEFDPATVTARMVGALDALMSLPKHARQPLPGGDLSPGAAFAASLGAQAGPFAASLAGDPSADDHIRVASPLLARGEGGIMHHRNESPDDPHLRLWAGLVSEAAGRPDVAADEFAAARLLGLGRYPEPST